MKLLRISLLLALLIAAIAIFKTTLVEVGLGVVGRFLSVTVNSSISDVQLDYILARKLALREYGLTISDARLDYSLGAQPYKLEAARVEYENDLVNFTCNNCKLHTEKQNFRLNPFSLINAELNFPDAILKTGVKSNLSYHGKIQGLVSSDKIDLNFDGHSKELGELIGNYKKIDNIHYYTIKNQPSLDLITNVNLIGQIYTNATVTHLKNEKITANIFGGKISVSPFTHQLNKNVCSTANLKLTKLSITKILELYQQEQIKADGTISGLVPIELCKNTWSIKEGILSADSPGHVKIPLPESGADVATNFAFQALKDFTYSQLSAKLNVANNGDMQITISIQGLPQTLNKKTPIVVNLNVADNIYDLLRSLNVSKEIVKRIEKHYHND